MAVSWLIIGTVGGGVWKTTNCCSPATTRTVVTDNPLDPLISTAIYTIVIDPRNPNTIYAGTGDVSGSSYGSRGILKSTNAGATWTVLGADVFGMAYSGESEEYNAVGKVRVDPNNSNKVVAGTKRGLYFSYDGGLNWRGPCFTNPFGATPTPAPTLTPCTTATPTPTPTSTPETTPPQRQDVTGLELSRMLDGTTRIIAAIGNRGALENGENGANGI